MADATFRRAETIFEDPQIGSSPSTLSLDQPLVEIRPRWERAAELGFSADELGFAVAALSDSAFVGEYSRGDDDVFPFSMAGSRSSCRASASCPSTHRAARWCRCRWRTWWKRWTRIPSDRVRSEVIGAMRAGGKPEQGVDISISGASDQLTATRAALRSKKDVLDQKIVMV